MTLEVRNTQIIVELVRERLQAMRKQFARSLSDEATRIVVRTQRGLDVEGRALSPYSERYAKFRERKGRNTRPVDLTFTGNMLAAVRSEVTEAPDGLVGRIFFNSAREAKKAYHNNERRPFFGLSEEQVKRITDAVRNAR